jgi:predicted adenine nucleotide alpha hydrolase (AANH) superfamily ATPase
VKLLLHCCCGPCAALVADHFRALGDTVTGWFFNPNIHPPEERRRRERALTQAAQAIGLPLLPVEDGMGWAGFLLEQARRQGPRCRACYELRMEATAREAARRGFEAFSTTLVISPYQDVVGIADLGRAIADRCGVKFRSADLRERYPESCERSRELGLYRQHYCGCQFSLLERAERRLRRRRAFRPKAEKAPSPSRAAEAGPP